MCQTREKNEDADSNRTHHVHWLTLLSRPPRDGAASSISTRLPCGEALGRTQHAEAGVQRGSNARVRRDVPRGTLGPTRGVHLGMLAEVMKAGRAPVLQAFVRGRGCHGSAPHTFPAHVVTRMRSAGQRTTIRRVVSDLNGLEIARARHGTSQPGSACQVWQCRGGAALRPLSDGV